MQSVDIRRPGDHPHRQPRRSARARTRPSNAGRSADDADQAHEPRTDGTRAGVKHTLRTGGPVAAPRGRPPSAAIRRTTTVMSDLLASGHHATLVTDAAGCADAGTGSPWHVRQRRQRIKAAVLREDDVVTIGNVDLVFAGGGEDGELVRRTMPATTTGGLDVRDVSLDDRGNRALLDRISFSASPATLTAVIGPSGSGKSTLSKVIVGCAAEKRHSVVRRARRPRRLRVVAQPDRHRAPGRRGARSAHRRSGAGLRGRTAHAVRHHRGERQRVIAQVLEELEMTPTPRPVWTSCPVGNANVRPSPWNC